MARERKRRRLERLRRAPSLLAGGLIGGAVVAASRRRRRGLVHLQGLAAFDDAPCARAQPDGEPAPRQR